MTKGLLLLNKPKGITSFSAVSKIKWLLGEKRVGHTGTLDPMATGVLPIFTGRATALSSYLLDADKRYTATIKFGIVTDTGDITGNVTEENAVNITEADIDRAIAQFTGEITQVPPMYSAIKRNGVPLYKLAREGKTVEIEPRQVIIYAINKISKFENNSIVLDILCSKGTYIRSLAMDIGSALGTGATLTDLCRTATSGFEIEDCIDLDKLTKDNIASYIMPEERAVENLRYITVSEKQGARFLNGGQLSLERVHGEFTSDKEILRVKYSGEFLGLGEVDLASQQINVKCVIGETAPTKTAVALGTFDGVHRGHAEVIRGAVHSGYKPIAVTFATPPKMQLGQPLAILMSTMERENAFRKIGIKKIKYINFEDFKDYSPHQFLQYLRDEIHCAFISCGFNYHFGKNGSGDVQLLKQFCRDNDIGLNICEPIYVGDSVVSSSFIREMLLKGQVEKANDLLFSPFGFSNTVTHGDARGRTLGFPTINQLYPEGLARLKFGVYKTQVSIDGKEYVGVTNVGIRPTFETDFVSAETFILDFDSDVYGKNIDIRFLRFLRDEKKFESVEELKKAVNKDIDSVK